MLSLNASAIMVGVAIGSAAGGASLAHGGWMLVASASGTLALSALLHLVVSDRLCLGKIPSFTA